MSAFLKSKSLVLKPRIFPRAASAYRARRDLHVSSALSVTRTDTPIAEKEPLNAESVASSDLSEESPLRQRFEQLAENAAPSSADPLAGRPADALDYSVETPEAAKRPSEEKETLEKELREAGLTTSEGIQRVIDRFEQLKFDETYRAEISATKLPRWAPRSSVKAAASRAWDGHETAEEVALRMLLDKHRSAKNPVEPADKLGSSVAPPKSFRGRKPDIQRRLSEAREKSLDYTLKKHAESTGVSGVSPQTSAVPKSSFEEDPGFREMYRERLLGPEVLGATSFSATGSSIKALADRRVEEARRNGAFDNLPRGKPLASDPHASSPYIETTEYFLNNILKRQDVAPPWIEKQASLDAELGEFRRRLANDWRKRAVHLIVDKHAGEAPSALLRLARYYAGNELAGRDPRLRDDEWLAKECNYLDLMIRKLNDSIRGYNLQAPGPARWPYLQTEEELNKCYQEVARTLEEDVDRHLNGPKAIELPEGHTNLYTASELRTESAEKMYGLKDLARDLFGRRKK